VLAHLVAVAPAAARALAQLGGRRGDDGVELLPGRADDGGQPLGLPRGAAARGPPWCPCRGRRSPSSPWRATGRRPRRRRPSWVARRRPAAAPSCTAGGRPRASRSPPPRPCPTGPSPASRGPRRTYASARPRGRYAPVRSWEEPASRPPGWRYWWDGREVGTRDPLCARPLGPHPADMDLF
jgi:hypothetical protein